MGRGATWAGTLLCANPHETNANPLAFAGSACGDSWVYPSTAPSFPLASVSFPADSVASKRVNCAFLWATTSAAQSNWQALALEGCAA